MPVHNADIARIFEEIADILEIEGDNPFRIRAYRNAARSMGGFGRDLGELVRSGEDLTRLPSIGKDLAAKIEEIVATGECAALKRLRRQVPAAVTELLDIPGLGPKRVRALYHELDIHSREQLARACRTGAVRSLPGFGAKTEQRILQAIEGAASETRRYKRAVAEQYAEGLLAWLRQGEGVERVSVAGSYRRARDTVGDLDILVVARDGAAATSHFLAYDEIGDVVSHGGTRSTVYLKSGIQVDLRVVEAAAFGAALHYFTGSKAHNIAVRRLGQRRGLKINEYGVYRGKRRVAGRTEEDVYAAVDLPWIAPELRENAGEIEAARQGALPQLIERADLRGDLHCHTRASDGHDGLREMAEAAREAGLEYLAVTDHTQHLRVAHGLDSSRLLRQMDEIDSLNEALEGIVLLKGAEVDIYEDGALDLPGDVLARLDVVIGAVHSRFDLPRAQQTRRVLRALDSPHLHILAHPGGRLIGEREPMDLDMPRVLRRAREQGVALELNASPDRLDLTDVYCRMARDEGVRIAINSDAHGTGQFSNLRFGVEQARRGWLERGDVLNTRTLKQLRRLLRR